MTVPTEAEVDAMTPRELKTLETRLRRAAQRQGFRLEKSRRRDPRALGYGTYQVVNPEGNGVVDGTDGMSLAQIAEWLFSDYEEEGKE